eukprot:6182771-Pleurochrysis_carterae.AAC.3
MHCTGIPQSRGRGGSPSLSDINRSTAESWRRRHALTVGALARFNHTSEESSKSRRRRPHVGFMGALSTVSANIHRKREMVKPELQKDIHTIALKTDANVVIIDASASTFTRIVRRLARQKPASVVPIEPSAQGRGDSPSLNDTNSGTTESRRQRHALTVGTPARSSYTNEGSSKPSGRCPHVGFTCALLAVSAIIHHERVADKPKLQRDIHTKASTTYANALTIDANASTFTRTAGSLARQKPASVVPVESLAQSRSDSLSLKYGSTGACRLKCRTMPHPNRSRGQNALHIKDRQPGAWRRQPTALQVQLGHRVRGGRHQKHVNTESRGIIRHLQNMHTIFVSPDRTAYNTTDEGSRERVRREMKVEEKGAGTEARTRGWTGMLSRRALRSTEEG